MHLADALCVHMDEAANAAVPVAGKAETSVIPANLEALTVAELKALATAEGIDLGNAEKKSDIVAAIRASRVVA